MQLTDARPSRDPALFWVNHRDAPARTTAHAGARKRALALVLQPAGGGGRGAAMRAAWSHPSKSGEVHSGQLLFSRCVQLLQPCSSNCDTAPLTERKTCRARRPPNGRGLRAERVRAGGGAWSAVLIILQEMQA